MMKMYKARVAIRELNSERVIYVVAKSIIEAAQLIEEQAVQVFPSGEIVYPSDDGIPLYTVLSIKRDIKVREILVPVNHFGIPEGDE